MLGKLLDFLDKILTFFEEWTLFVSVIVALVGPLCECCLKVWVQLFSGLV